MTTETRQVSGLTYTPSELELAAEEMGNNLGLILNPSSSDIWSMADSFGRSSQKVFARHLISGREKVIYLSHNRLSPLHFGRYFRVEQAASSRGRGSNLPPGLTWQNRDVQRNIILNPRYPKATPIIRYPESVTVSVYDKDVFNQPAINAGSKPDLSIKYDTTDLYLWREMPEEPENFIDRLILESHDKSSAKSQNYLAAFLPEGGVFQQVLKADVDLDYKFSKGLSFGRLACEIPANTPSSVVLALIGNYLLEIFELPKAS